MNQLEREIANTFRSFQPRKFRKANGKYTNKILEKVLGFVKRYPKAGWEYHDLVANDSHGGFYCSTDKKLGFSMTGYEYNEMTDKDVAFLVAHEVGHMLDFTSGRIAYNFDTEPEYMFLETGEQISIQMIEDLFETMMTTKSKKKARLLVQTYASTVAEYVANVFAAKHVERPDELTFQIMHDVGSGKLSKIEIDT